MATVGEVSAPYANFLRRTLPAGPGVCDVCQTSLVPPWTRCYQCTQAYQSLPATADSVGFIGLAVKSEQFAHELWHYKYSPRAEVRARFQLGLAAVLWRWMARHEPCLATAAAVSQFELVTVVPSTSVPTSHHQLRKMVSSQVGPTKVRYLDLLDVDPQAPQGRSHDERRWLAHQGLHNESVLIIDDTWTTGGHAQSAAAALKKAGAGKVALLALGRHFQRYPADERYREPAEDYYRRSRAAGWDWNLCSVTDHTR